MLMELLPTRQKADKQGNEKHHNDYGYDALAYSPHGRLKQRRRFEPERLSPLAQLIGEIPPSFGRVFVSGLKLVEPDQSPRVADFRIGPIWAVAAIIHPTLISRAQAGASLWAALAPQI